jgi:hypothetical protein
MRRTPVLVAVGLLLAVAGGALLWRGAADGPAGLTVAGVLLLVAGLAGLRVAYWQVRVRAMTRAGLALRGPDAGDHEERPDAP